MCNRFVSRASWGEICALSAELGLDVAKAGEWRERPQAEAFPDRDVAVLRPGPAAGLVYGPLRWGLPPPPGMSAPITNIRRLQSRWWQEANRDWILPAAFRCLVPFTAFAEPARASTWFAATEGTLACFAGIWRPWRGARLAPRPGLVRRVRTVADWELFAFLTTEANALVRPVHPQAMPVVLTRPEEMRLWLAGGTDGFRLQRPLDEDRLRICPAPVPGGATQDTLFS